MCKENPGPIEAIDYGTRRGSEDYVFARRSIESIETPTDLDKHFSVLIPMLKNCKTKGDRDMLLSSAGGYLGEYLEKEFIGDPEKRLDIGGEMRVKALFQEFLERQFILHGSTNAVEDYAKDPAFRNALLEHGNVRNIIGEKLADQFAGAESTFKFYEKYKNDERLVFMGSEVNLDTRHAIDLVLIIRGDVNKFLSGEKEEAPQNPSDEIETVLFVQIKTKAPREEDVAKINTQHKSYRDAVTQFITSGIGTDEDARKLEKGTRLGNAESMIKLKEIMSFYESVGQLEKGKDLITWLDVMQIAKKVNIDPVIFFIRMKNLPTDQLDMIHNETKRQRLSEIQNQIRAINPAKSPLTRYSRQVRPENHIARAGSFISVIAVQDNIHKQTKLD